MSQQGRLALRLAMLSHDALVQLAAQLCADSPAARNTADAVIAAEQPVPQWAVEGVLLSEDLVQHLLAPLELEDGAAAAVCSLWAKGWKATSEPRRRLRVVPGNALPDDLRDCDQISVAAIPGNDPGQAERLVISNSRYNDEEYTRETRVRILDRSMRTVFDWAAPSASFSTVAADRCSVFLGKSATLLRFSLDGQEVARYEEGAGGRCLAYPTLAPGGLLFAVAYQAGQTGSEHATPDATDDEIVALDADSLELRYRFGRLLLQNANGMAVVGDELFVCDMDRDCLQVFSLAGEHHRSIVGEWKRPLRLCAMKDRLYLVEEEEAEEDEEEHAEDAEDEEEIQRSDSSKRGRRMFVLSLQGETLQIFPFPLENRGYGVDCCGFNGKLLVAHYEVGQASTLMTLCGL